MKTITPEKKVLCQNWGVDHDPVTIGLPIDLLVYHWLLKIWLKT